METLDLEACYRALQTRDERFDGRLFVGVTSTGIYCRPICPARTAKRENCRFFASAAAAQEAGFRPCLRCRPETAPDLASWRGTSNTVSRALALMAEGALDNAESGVEELAERLGIGDRQLRRLFQQHLGTTPIAVAQTRRVLFAKQLIHETRLSMSDVALAAGFGSIRRFNETFLRLFGRPPGMLRRANQKTTGAAPQAGVTLRLRYRPPYDWDCMLAFLRGRALNGVEQVENRVYRRTVQLNGQAGVVMVAQVPARSSLAITIYHPDVSALPSIVTRVRRVFDLNADVEAIGTQLSSDPLLAPLVAQRPGLRVPGGWEGFELAVRAVLGQQVTVEAGRQLGNQLVSLCGGFVEAAPGAALSRTFPTAEQVCKADLDKLRMPNARKRTLRALAEIVQREPNLFRPFGTIEEAVGKLREIAGIGEWTAQYIALRALRETDAFPATDIGLLRGIGAFAGGRPSPASLLERAEPWRPWRAYAAQHLWAADADALSLREVLRG